MKVKFYFMCPNCKKYKVTEKKFLFFVPSDWKTKFEEQVQEERVVEAIIEFKTECPNCSSKGESELTVQLLKEPAKA